MANEDPFALNVNVGAARDEPATPDRLRTVLCPTAVRCITAKRVTCGCNFTSICTAGCPFDHDK